MFIYSKAGGMAIEDVAHSNPEMIHKIHVNTKEGLDVDKLYEAAENLGLS